MILLKIKRNLASKSVKVDKHKKSPPSSPAYPGPGNKPGPKTVVVHPYTRTPPSK